MERERERDGSGRFCLRLSLSLLAEPCFLLDLSATAEDVELNVAIGRELIMKARLEAAEADSNCVGQKSSLERASKLIPRSATPQRTSCYYGWMRTFRKR